MVNEKVSGMFPINGSKLDKKAWRKAQKEKIQRINQAFKPKDK